jgi:hypothetical protein
MSFLLIAAIRGSRFLTSWRQGYAIQVAGQDHRAAERGSRLVSCFSAVGVPRGARADGGAPGSPIPAVLRRARRFPAERRGLAEL